jgi:DNA-binding transcriptional LysR family regulator
MKIRDLEYFVTVAETGSINRAAQRLFVSQPHLGKIIAKLEEDMDTHLLFRTTTGVSLTPEGEEFLFHAHKVLDEMKELEAINKPGARCESSLEVSMTKFSHIMESFIEVVIRHKDDKTFSHKLNEGSMENVMNDVYSRRVKIGVLDFGTRRRDEIMEEFAARGLVYTQLATIQPYIIISKNHPLIRNGKPLTLETLSNYGFVRYTGQYEDFMYRIFDKTAERNLSHSPKIVYLDSRASLLHLISDSDFYSIGIYDFDCQESSYRVISVPIECKDSMLEFGYIMPENAVMTPITSEFIHVLKGRFSNMK